MLKIKVSNWTPDYFDDKDKEPSLILRQTKVKKTKKRYKLFQRFSDEQGNVFCLVSISGLYTSY